MTDDKIKLSGPSMEDRIAARLRNSGQGQDLHPDQHAVHGTGPLRTHTNIFHGGHNRNHGGGDEGKEEPGS